MKSDDENIRSYPDIPIGVFYNKFNNKIFVMWSTPIGEYMECCTDLECDHFYEDMVNRYFVKIGEF
jgi:hypothetical protein